MRAAIGGDVRGDVSAQLVDALRAAVEWRKNKLTSSANDEQGILFQPRMDKAEKARDAEASLARFRL